MAEWLNTFDSKNNEIMKSKGIAYLLWLISIFGWLGFHRFYLGKIGTGILWIITGGVLGIGSLIDLFTLGGQVFASSGVDALSNFFVSLLRSVSGTRRGFGSPARTQILTLWATWSRLR